MRPSFRLPAAALCALIPLALSALPASALPVTTYRYFTTLTPTASASVGRLEINWTTALDSGIATEADLISLRFLLWAPAPSSTFLIVADTAIAGSVVQPLGGAARSLADLDFAFDIDAYQANGVSGLLAFDNDLGGSAPTAPGTALDASGTGSAMAVSVWNDGGYLGGWSGAVEESTAVPLPAAAPLLAFGLAGLVALSRRRAG
ncbi:MAG: hypothetical protein VYD87_03445 [Pseudomonadota bacterium]|nr:hypothetical protein [Pseudomonadota bacterium]MEE3101956.1 hypothetical protein [Pseudomonadota bacterium]